MDIVLYCYGKVVVRVHFGYLNECGLVPGGRQLIGHTANSTCGLLGRTFTHRHLSYI